MLVHARGFYFVPITKARLIDDIPNGVIAIIGYKSLWIGKMNKREGGCLVQVFT